MRLNHPNVVQCLGATVDPPQIVMDWMPNGEIMDYVQKNRGVSRIDLVSSRAFAVRERSRSIWRHTRY
jgi:hypothetical protein